MNETLLTLPEEPPPGSVVEIVGGNNNGQRWRRAEQDDPNVSRDNPRGRWFPAEPVTVCRGDARMWSSLWWRLVEDDGDEQRGIRVLGLSDPEFDPLWTARAYDDYTDGHAWIKTAVSAPRPWIDWTGKKSRSNAEMVGCRVVPLAELARAMGHPFPEPQACGRGLCALNDGHEGSCRV